MTVLHYRIDLPRWDTDWRQTGYKKNTKTGKLEPVKTRDVWDQLTGNSRAHWAKRSNATQTVIQAVSLLAGPRKHNIPQSDHLRVRLCWAPGDNRRADEDNLWPLFKVCCDGLARGPRTDLPGLHLVPDDTSEYMTKVHPVIVRPPKKCPSCDREFGTAKACTGCGEVKDRSTGLWLEVTASIDDKEPT